jgi:hypothetical protein
MLMKKTVAHARNQTLRRLVLRLLSEKVRQPSESQSI